MPSSKLELIGDEMLGERIGNFLITIGLMAATLSVFMLFGPSDQVSSWLDKVQPTKTSDDNISKIEPRQPVSLNGEVEIIED